MASTTAYALTVDQENRRHAFQGTGDFDMDWLTACFSLFKQHRIIIRSLAIHPDFRHLDKGRPLNCSRCLAIVFDTPDSAASRFFDDFSSHLESIRWKA